MLLNYILNKPSYGYFIWYESFVVRIVQLPLGLTTYAMQQLKKVQYNDLLSFEKRNTFDDKQQHQKRIFEFCIVWLVSHHF